MINRLLQRFIAIEIIVEFPYRDDEFQRKTELIDIWSEDLWTFGASGQWGLHSITGL